MKIQATALPAEITFGSWGRALWVTAANSGYEKTKDDGSKSWENTVVTDIHQSWGGDAPRVGLAVGASTETVGFNVDFRSNGFDGITQGDNAYIWIKPLEMVKLSVGKMDDGTAATGAGFGLWDWDRLGCVNNGAGDGWTFGKYFQNNGVNVQVTPIEGLLVGLAVPLKLNEKEHEVATITKDDDSTENYQVGTLEDAWLNSAFVVAYDIQQVGTVKAALKLHHVDSKTKYIWNEDEGPELDFDDDGNFTGKFKTETTAEYYKDKDKKDVKTWCNIAAAFDLVSVENLFASVGVEIPTLNTKPILANAYACYGVSEQLAIHALLGTQINKKDEKESAKKDKYETGLGFNVGVGVDFSLEESILLQADVRYANGVYMASTSADNKDNLTLGVGAAKLFSNGSLGIAFEGSTNGYGRYSYEKEKDGSCKAFAWEIPVRFQYSF